MLNYLLHIFYADMIKSLLNQLTFTGENPKKTANEIFRLFSIMYLYFHHIFRFWCRHFNNFDYGLFKWLMFSLFKRKLLQILKHFCYCLELFDFLWLSHK